MRYVSTEYCVKSSDDNTVLFGKIYLPVGTPKATVQIIHGMSEHTELYEDFMTFLAQNGFAVFIHDQRGHGKTAGTPEKLGLFAESNGDKIIIDDAYKFSKELLHDFSGIKHFLFGHSMGSFAARICSEKYPEMADALILEGTGSVRKGSKLSLALTDIGSRIQDNGYLSKVTQKTFFDIYNYEFKEERSDYSWLTRDTDVIKRHENDPYFNFNFTLKAMNDLVALSCECNSDEWFKNFRHNLPTLIISGEKDPVGEDGIGVMEVYKNLKNEGVKDLTFKLYSDCRHELLNELNKADIMQDILNWINARI